MFYCIILVAFMLNTVTMNASYSSSSDREYVLKAAQRLGPEEMIKAFFFKGGGLDKNDYNDPEEVYIVQQYIATQLYPGRRDLFERAVCTLGECLKESGDYTTGQVNRVVHFMLNFKK